VAGLSCHLAAPSNEIAVAEGIETALSVQLATGIPTWAALSAGGLRRLILLPAPNAGLVTIAFVCFEKQSFFNTGQNGVIFACRENTGAEERPGDQRQRPISKAIVMYFQFSKEGFWI